MAKSRWEDCGGEGIGDMEEYLTGKGTDRQLQLFACACCRHIDYLLNDSRSRVAVDVAEKYADRMVSEEVLEAAWQEANTASGEIEETSEVLLPAALAAQWCAVSNSESNVFFLSHVALYAQLAGGPPRERDWQAQVLQDILGNTKPTMAPAWRSSTVIAICRQIYESRDFSLCPIIADALQDAGCDNEDILNHLRGPGPHVRGCWVIDLILGKA